MRPGLRDGGDRGCVLDERRGRDRLQGPGRSHDLASFVTGVQQCSPVAYPVNPSLLDCATKDQHPQTYYGSMGASGWYKGQIEGDAHGVYVASNDSAVGQRATDLLYEFPKKLGMKTDQHA